MEKIELTDGEFYSEQIFKKIDLTEKKFRNIEFYKCTFKDSNFFKTVFIECTFENCTFENSDVSLINLGGSRLQDVLFTECKGTGVDWTILERPYSFSSKMNFKGCRLDSSSFYKMELHNILFEECSIKEADFIESDLTKASFKSSDLLNSRFNNSNLSLADFSGAINYRIDPNQCKLKKTVFTMPDAMNLLSGYDIIIK